MSHSSDIPLHLHQVLEEEYANIHEPISLQHEFLIKLPEKGFDGALRCVKAKPDWDFREGHIKSLRSFAAAVLEFQAERWGDTVAHYHDAQTAAPQSRELNAYLVSKLSDGLQQALRDYLSTPDEESAETISRAGEATPESASHPDELINSSSHGTTGQLEAQVNAALNSILDDPHLYTEERFKHVPLGYSTRGFLELLPTFKSFQIDSQNASSPAIEERDDDLVHLNRLLLEDAYPDAFVSITEIRLAAIKRRFHTTRQTALCLSGGGIRSGIFALGIIQGLARHKLLEKFDYLSTVAGGGYIGSWLSAWIHRHPGGLEGACNELASHTSDIDPDPEPIRYLRRNSSSMLPKVGLFNTDMWTFIGIYLRNLLLTSLVLVPIVMAVLLFPRLIVSAILTQSDRPVGYSLHLFGVESTFPYYPRYTLLLLGTFLLIRAIIYIYINHPGTREQLQMRSPFWAVRTDRRSFLLYCLIPLVASAMLLTTSMVWAHTYMERMELPLFLLFGVVTTLFSWVWYTFVVLKRGSYGRWHEIKLNELITLMLAGLFGGFIFWWASASELNPVVRFVDGSPLTWRTEFYACFAVPVFLLTFLLATNIYIGISSYSRAVSDAQRVWFAHLSASLLIVIMIWVGFSSLVMFAPQVLLYSPKALLSIGGISGLISLLISRVLMKPADQGFMKTAVKKEDGNEAGLSAQVIDNLHKALVWIFLSILAATVALLPYLTSLIIKTILTNPFVARYDWLFSVEPYAKHRYIEELSRTAVPVALHIKTVHYPSFWFFLLLIVGLSLSSYLISRLINLNLFSLHGEYRNRLIKSFLGASRTRHERRSHPFTNFDPADNLHMHELRPQRLRDADFQTRWGTSEENLTGLALQLNRASILARDASAPVSIDPMSGFLYRHLRQNTREAIDALQRNTPASQALQQSLIEDLNRILEDANVSFHTEPSLRSYAASKRVRNIQRAVFASREAHYPDDPYHALFKRLMLEQAYTRLIKPLTPPPYKLFHIINTTLHLLGGSDSRHKGFEPFSISPLHCGSFRIGYRNSKDYGGDNGISLGTAAAISGMAGSSKIGTATSPAMSLLLTIFNVRPGWWLGNPGFAGNKTYMTPDPQTRRDGKNKVYRRASPASSLLPLLDEALGRTDDKNEYVYLSNGGHFENLGLYEMVLRRCHLIVVSDGGQDEEFKFHDLGNAVRKIRIDLGIPIEFSKIMIYPAARDGKSGLYWAVGRIRYSAHDADAPDGTLIYIKPTVYGETEPQDVLEYKRSHPSFPHETTGDQYFDEPQFESYRMLGSHIIDEICGANAMPRTLEEFVEAAIVREESLAEKPRDR